MPGKTGILVIHGIGEQAPFETLDLFCVNWIDYVKTQGEDIEVTHKRRRTEQNRYQDYVSIHHPNGQEIDVHEYYWAHRVKRDISFSEVLNWLVTTSDGAREYYDEYNEYVQEQEPPFKNGRFIFRWYVKPLGRFFRTISMMPWVIRWLIPAGLDRLIHLLIGRTRRLFLNYIGDVVIYTSSDLKSEYYQYRECVLNGAVEKIRDLMLNHDYEQLIILGHSMGSVIAYDALKRVNHEMNHDEHLQRQRYKIKSLLTTGSPLDKVAFFFRHRAKKSAYVRKFLIYALHGFRTREKPFIPKGITLETPVKDHLEHVKWVNFWDPGDPISGHLDYYRDVENIRVDNQRDWGITHMYYWSNRDVYRRMMDMIKRGF
ncbi:MAG: hypothetical protein H0Z33_02255 [Bacillaceae bacterium]|nr:hypothetical protein [Bacillaceae bacterium]